MNYYLLKALLENLCEQIEEEQQTNAAAKFNDDLSIKVLAVVLMIDQEAVTCRVLVSEELLLSDFSEREGQKALSVNEYLDMTNGVRQMKGGFKELFKERVK